MQMIYDTKVLLVDDDFAVCEALKRALASENFYVLTASSSTEALLACEQNKIDIVLLDLNLGNEDGWEVFDLLKGLRADLPIVVISAHAERLAHCNSSRARGALEKPFELSALMSLLGRESHAILAEPRPA